MSKKDENRKKMPIITKLVDDFREVFGADQVKVICAEEDGYVVGDISKLETPTGVENE